jgi:hypothetical protein
MSDKKNSYVDSFLHNLKILIKEALNFIPEDPKVYRINKRVMLAIQYDPAFTFNKVGGYLYKYKDFIYDATTEDLLLKWEFDEALDEEDKELEDVSLLVISELKRCMTQMSKEQKEYYRSMVAGLLDDYLEYQCA